MKLSERIFFWNDEFLIQNESKLHFWIFYQFFKSKKFVECYPQLLIAAERSAKSVKMKFQWRAVESIFIIMKTSRKKNGFRPENIFFSFSQFFLLIFVTLLSQ